MYEVRGGGGYPMSQVLWKAKNAKPEHVYFILDVESETVKIGAALFPERRLANMQSGNPHTLRVAKVIEYGGVRLERELHRLFRDAAIGHEWFRLTPEIREYIGQDLTTRPLKIDDELRQFLPPLSDGQKIGLEQDMLKHGCLSPLVLWGETLVEGYHRYDICQRHSIPFNTIRLNFSDKEDALFWLFRHHRDRRNMSKFQLAEKALPFKPRLEAEAKNRKREAGHIYHRGNKKVFLNQENLSDAPMHTGKLLADLAGVSADTIAKVEVIQQKATEEQKVRLVAGEATINQVYVELRRQEKQAATKPASDLPEGVFQVFYMDPPWKYDNSGLGGSAESHYRTRTVDEMLAELQELDFTSRMAPDCVLFLWATNPLLPDALRLIDELGFEYKTNLAWVKNKSTYGKLGFYVYGQHELLLIATQGYMLPKGEKPASVIYADVKDHSRKPKEAYEVIDQMYPNTKKCELFGRKKHEGWEVWGDQLSEGTT